MDKTEDVVKKSMHNCLWDALYNIQHTILCLQQLVVSNLQCSIYGTQSGAGGSTSVKCSLQCVYICVYVCMYRCVYAYIIQYKIRFAICAVVFNVWYHHGAEWEEAGQLYIVKIVYNVCNMRCKVGGGLRSIYVCILFSVKCSVCTLYKMCYVYNAEWEEGGSTGGGKQTMRSHGLLTWTQFILIKYFWKHDKIFLEIL